MIFSFLPKLQEKKTNNRRWEQRKDTSYITRQVGQWQAIWQATKIPLKIIFLSFDWKDTLVIMLWFFQLFSCGIRDNWIYHLEKKKKQVLASIKLTIMTRTIRRMRSEEYRLSYDYMFFLLFFYSFFFSWKNMLISQKKNSYLFVESN